MTRAREHGVVTGTAEHHVGAVAGQRPATARRHVRADRAGARADDVVAAEVDVGADDRVDVRGVEVGHEVEVAVVAEDDVGGVHGGVRVRGDRVAGRTAEDDVAARAGEDRVAAAEGRVDGLDPAEGHRQGAAAGGVLDRGGDPAAVADDHVQAVAGVDGVVADAGDHHVVALARADEVVAAEVGVRAPDPVEVGGLAVAQHAVDEAVVAQDDVAGVDRGVAADAAVARDRVVAGAAEDRVATGARRDRVVAAHTRVGGEDQPDQRSGAAVGLVAGPPVTGDQDRGSLEGQPGLRR